MAHCSVLELRASAARLLIDTKAGGRVASLAIDGVELLVGRGEGAEPFGWGSFVMAPWAGRIRRGRFTWDGVEHEFPATLGPHAIHGVVYDRPWRVDEAGPARTVLSCDLSGAGSPWPFGGRVVHTLQLHPDRLEQRLELQADGGALPATVGWHPWWRRRLPSPGGGPPVDVRIDADLSLAQLYRRDDDHIPDGRLVPAPPGPWDDCFRGAGPVVLRWPGVLELAVEHDCSHLVVFDELDHAVCVEPQTGPPDAFTLDPASCVVRPGRPLVARVTWRWRWLARPTSRATAQGRSAASL